MAVENQTAREKILQRVINLRAKAENDGASEAEMMSALTMAAKLMDSYDIEEAELALAESTGRIVLEIVTKKADVTCLKNKNRHPVVQVLTSIAKFTHTKVIISSATGSITYTGHKPDTEMANYLTALIREALDQEWERYRWKNPNHGRGAKSGFQVSMANRVAWRLHELAEQQEAERNRAAQAAIEDGRTASSTALVLVDAVKEKLEAAEAVYKQTFTNVRKTNGLTGGRNYTAHAAGDAAGYRVGLGRPVSGSGTKKLA